MKISPTKLLSPAWFLVFCAWFLPLALRAESPAYNVRFWTVKDGLPNHSVQALLQTSDGFLWVGTSGGWAAFDGVKFTRPALPGPPRLEQASITALAETPDHALWIGTLGQGLVRYAGGEAKWFNQTNGLPRNNVRALFTARDGTLWIGTDNGAMRFHQGKFETVAGADFGGAVTDFREDANQNVYLASLRGVNIVRPSRTDTAPEAVLLQDASTAGLVLVSARTLAFDRAGTLWVGANRALARMHPGTVQRGFSVTNLAHDIVSAIQEDKRGNLWVGTYGGLNQIPAGASTPVEITREGEAFDFIQAMLEDREGNFWIGTKEGLARLQPQSFQTYSRQDGLRHNNVMSVMEDKHGQMWCGTWGGGIHGREADRFLPRAPEGDEGNTLVTALFGDDQGQIWYGADNAIGLFCLRENTQRHYTVADGFTAKGPRVIRQSRAGVFWIGTREGVFSLAESRFTRYTTENGLNANGVWDLHEDRAGRIWAATDKGVDVFQDGRWRHVGLSRLVRCFYEDADGALWMGTRNGLAYYKDGALRTTREALPHSILGILEDDQQRFWLSSPTGIYALPKSDLGAVLAQKTNALQPMLYDTSDGLLTESCNGLAQPSCWKSRDGRLWFATARGLAALNPKQARQINARPPPVAVTEVWANKKPLGVSRFQFSVSSEDSLPAANLKLETSNPLTIAPGRSELEFRYTALSFNAAEKNRFRYKLEGADSDWVEAGGRREAYYYNLPPGDYVFRVTAANNDGVWNPLGANVKFTLQPHYWQTRWFKLCVIFASLSVVIGSVRYVTKRRMQRQLERLEHQHAIEKERTRIARDMHDDLGARFTEILLATNRVRERQHDPTEMAAYTERMTVVAGELSDNMSALVWAVNPQNDALDRFAPYVCERAQAFLENAAIRCRFDVPDEWPDFPITSELRHHLFLVIKEALHNAVKYAQCSEVRLTMCVEGATLRIELADNGKGFARTAVSTFGNGLLNMEKRMQEISGKCVIESVPGQGTRIRLEVPLNP